MIASRPVCIITSTTPLRPHDTPCPSSVNSKNFELNAMLTRREQRRDQRLPDGGHDEPPFAPKALRLFGSPQRYHHAH